MDIILTREFQNSWVFQDERKLKWWIDLYLMADERGEIHMSLADLARRWNTSKTTVHSFIKKIHNGTINGTTNGTKTERITLCDSMSYKDARNDNGTENGTISGTAQRIPPCSPSSFSPTPPITSPPIIPQENRTNDLACAREDFVCWDEARESGFVERFKAQGSAILIMRVTGKSPEDVMRLLDVYLASRQMKDLGHKDFNHFLEAFQYAIKNNKISIPVTPSQPKERKVISGADVLKVYG